MEMLILLLVPLTLCVRAEECPTPNTVSNKTRQELLQSGLQFSTDLLQSAAALSTSPSQNIFMSPFSVYNALLIAYFSASGKTEETYKRTLRLPSDENKNDVLGNYFETKKHSQVVPSKKYKLNYASRIYISSILKVKDCMKKLFAEDIVPENFIDNAAGAVQQINSWVAKETNNMITNALPQNALKSRTMFVLVNAVFFKGTWKTKFSNNTKEDKFHRADKTTAPVMLMQQTSLYKIRQDSALDALILELPYDGDEVSMFVLLPVKPSPDAIHNLLQKLSVESVENALKAMSSEKPQLVNVYLPKFTAVLEYDIKSLLGTPPFNSNDSTSLFHSADFSLLGDKDIDITKALHMAKIEVDEEGTVAAAATIVVGSSLPMVPPEPLVFRADRPFIYTIYDHVLGALLFTGVFNSP